MSVNRSVGRRAFLLVLISTAFSAHGQSSASTEQRFPDVVAVKVKASGPDRFDFDVTISSPYDTPRRYADGFRVYTSDNVALGERKLLHDHQDEQPFTRDLHAVKVPPALKKVLVQARDRKFGYGGEVVEVVLPGR